MISNSKRFAQRSLFALLLGTAPLVSAPASANTAVAEQAASLSPGEFVWQPELSREGPVEIVVSIPDQMAYVFRGGTLIGASTVSTGKEGHETPAGRFEILQKRREHYSNRYNNAPMPFMQRLTWDGIALHAGEIPGRPASHGCIRLPMAFARALYGVTELGATVQIVEHSASSGEVASVAALDTVEFASN